MPHAIHVKLCRGDSIAASAVLVLDAIRVVETSGVIGIWLLCVQPVSQPWRREMIIEVDRPKIVVEEGIAFRFWISYWCGRQLFSIRGKNKRTRGWDMSVQVAAQC